MHNRSVVYRAIFENQRVKKMVTRAELAQRRKEKENRRAASAYLGCSGGGSISDEVGDAVETDSAPTRGECFHEEHGHTCDCYFTKRIEEEVIEEDNRHN